MPIRTSQTASSTRAWQMVAAARLGAVPAAGCPHREQARPQRSHARTQCLDDRQDRLEGPRVAVGAGGQQHQLGTPGLGVAAALSTAYALLPRGAVAHLDDVGGQHGGGGAQRPVGLVERGHHRPVGTPHHHHPHRSHPAPGRISAHGRLDAEHPRPRQVGMLRSPGAPVHHDPGASAPAADRCRTGGRSRSTPRCSGSPRRVATGRGPPAPRSACAAGSRGSRPRARRPRRAGAGRPPGARRPARPSPPASARPGRARAPCATARSPALPPPPPRSPATRQSRPIPRPARPGDQGEGERGRVDGVGGPRAEGHQIGDPGQRRDRLQGGLRSMAATRSRSCSTTERAGSRTGAGTASSSNTCSNGSRPGSPARPSGDTSTQPHHHGDLGPGVVVTTRRRGDGSSAMSGPDPRVCCVRTTR